jgi:hypothetical protein
MMMCAQKRRRALVRKKTANIKNLFLENSTNKDIEPFVAHVWEDIRQQHLLGMLEDLESLKYVPVKIRRKAASEPLSLFDTNSKVSEDQKILLQSER